MPPKNNLLQAAQDVVGIPLRYAQAGSSLVYAAMAGARQCVELQHYPRSDVVDTSHSARFYYHAHGARRKPDAEHGHFHLFGHGQQAGNYAHLIGISLDALGQPMRLFTTNRWVTGETWHSAQQVEHLLQHFQVATRGRMAPVARWVTAMVQLYMADIVRLVKKRDTEMERRCPPGQWDVLCEDRRLDVVTQSRISLAKKIQQLGY